MKKEIKLNQNFKHSVFPLVISLVVAVAFYYCTSSGFDIKSKILYQKESRDVHKVEPGPRKADKRSEKKFNIRISNGTIFISRFRVPDVKNGNIVKIEAKNFSEKEADIKIKFNSDASSVRLDKKDKIQVINIALKKKYEKRKNSLELLFDENIVSIISVEAGNVRFYKPGIFKFILIPKESKSYISPPMFHTFILFLIVFIFLYRTLLNQDAKKSYYFYCVSFTIIFFALPVIFQFFSDQKFLYDFGTYLLLLFLLFLFPVINASKRFIKNYSLKNFLFLILIPFLAFLVFFNTVKTGMKIFDGKHSGFIHIERSHIVFNPILKGRSKLKASLFKSFDGAYDGQFFYFIAFDPFMTLSYKDPATFKEVLNAYIDEPPYRYGRIGFPLLINFFSFNNPLLFPKTMIWLILISHILGIFFLIKIFIFYERSPLWSLLYLLIPGFYNSLFMALPEAVATAFSLAALYFYLAKKKTLVPLLFAAAILIRETSAILLVCIIFNEYYVENGRSLNLKKIFKIEFYNKISYLIISFIPYIIWKIFLTYKLYEHFGLKTLFFSPGDFTLPFFGIIKMFTHLFAGDYFHELILSAFFYPVLLTIMFFVSIYFLKKQLNFLSLSFFLYSLISISLNYEKIWVNVANGERTTFESFLFFLIVMVTGMKSVSIKKRRWLKILLLSFFLMVIIYNIFIYNYSIFFKTGFYKYIFYRLYPAWVF